MGIVFLPPHGSAARGRGGRQRPLPPGASWPSASVQTYRYF